MKPLETVMEKIFLQRLMFSFRLHEALHMNGIGEKQPKCGNRQLLVVLGFFRSSWCVDFALPNQPLSGGKRVGTIPKRL